MDATLTTHEPVLEADHLPARRLGSFKLHRRALRVDVVGDDGVTTRATDGLELSLDGIFLATPDFAPPVFSMLRVGIHDPSGGVLWMECEVVRCVSAARALAWGMSEGVGVLFRHCTEAQRRALAVLMQRDLSPRRAA